MLEASFDASRNRGASISGAYQYDTGQRIKMHGLPTPDDLAQMDDFLSGDVVTVQAQYAYKGDSQSEPRLCQYDAQDDCWLAEVPDAYLKQNKSVDVYVYVMYGADEAHSRSKTMYTGTFTPIARSAPSNDVTPDQLNAWDKLVAEINLVISKAEEAISNANAAAEGVNEAAREARDAAKEARDAANAANDVVTSWENVTTSTTTLEPGTDAKVTLSDSEDGNKHFSFEIPRGEKGEKGDKGPAGVTFTLRGLDLYIDTY